MELFAIIFWIWFNGYLLLKALEGDSSNTLMTVAKLAGFFAVAIITGVSLINTLQN